MFGTWLLVLLGLMLLGAVMPKDITLLPWGLLIGIGMIWLILVIGRFLLSILSTIHL